MAQPAERTDRVGCRYVFQSDVAGVTQFVEPPEQEREVDLARAWLVSTRIVSDLNVANAGEMFADRGGQLAFLALGVIHVVLQTHVGLRDFVEEFKRLLGAVEEEPRDVEVIDRFDEQLKPVFCKFRGGTPRILNERLPVLLVAAARHPFAGQTVQARHAEDLGIFDGPRHPVTELRLATGQSADATIPRRPVTGRQVEQHLLESVFIEFRLQVFRLERVGKQILDVGESGLAGQGEAFEEWHLGEEHGQVGGELRHGLLQVKGWVATFGVCGLRDSWHDGWRRHDHPFEDVGLEHDQDAHQRGQRDAVPEHRAQDRARVGAVLLPAGGDAGHDDALRVDHLAHDASGTVGGGGEDGREVKLLGGDFLQIAEQHVGGSVAPGQGHPQPAQQRREERKQQARRGKRQPHRGVGAAVARGEAQGEHQGDGQQRHADPFQGATVRRHELAGLQPEHEAGDDAGHEQCSAGRRQQVERELRGFGLRLTGRRRDLLHRHGAGPGRKVWARRSG